MAKILFVWEMGGGMGHIGRLLALARELVGRGHELALACPDPFRVERLLGENGIKLLTAPRLERRHAFAEPATLAEVLLQFELDAADVLEDQVRAWHVLVDEFAADLVVLDYAPVALLALRSRDCARVLFGTGFACPPDRYPLPSLRPWQDHYPDRLLLNEQLIHDSLNTVLVRLGQPPLDHVAQLFRDVERSYLATLPEFDHYPDRESGDYRGNWTLPGGVTPDWPIGEGPRVFVYLQTFAGLPALARALVRRGACALMYVPGLDPATRAAFEAAGVRCAPAPVDIDRAARDADLAILHAGHNTTVAMLLAGTPVLALPIYAEQALTARALERIGAGRNLRIEHPGAIAEALNEMLSNPDYTAAASDLAKRYTHLNTPSVRRELGDEISGLAESWGHTKTRFP